MWEAAVAAEWRGRPVWFHGDLAHGNLLVADGRLTAVIDFGTSGVGDPACDLVISWTMFAGRAGGRSVGRSARTTPPGHGRAAGPCGRPCSCSREAWTPTPDRRRTTGT
ncbi:phosphotransferase [Nonomuraea antimicrobica]